VTAPEPTEPQIVYPFGTPTEVVVEPAPARRTGRIVWAGVLALLVLAGVAVAILVLRPGGRQAGERGTAGAPAPGPASPAPSSPAPSASASPTASPSPSASPADPNLVADEEFSGPLDTATWSVYSSTHANGSSWTPDRVQVAGGELRVEGVGHNPTGAGNTAGGLCWCGLGDRRYGRWVVRARFDAGAGYGPVIGLWPNTNQGSDGAIGFAESTPAARNVLHGYVTGPAGKPAFAERTLPGDFTAWHTYTVDWRARAVKMYVDGKLYFDSSTVAGTVPPSVPMHLYVQLLAGPGDGVPAPDAHTPASVVLHVDWVRVFA
jgi:hypothetical protein